MKLHLSASSLSRVEKCPASASLPRVRQLHDDATAGTAEHVELEMEALAEGDQAEVAYAWNALTGKARHLGRGLDRAYGDLVEGEIPGTIDRLRIEAGRVVITDHKTGFGYMVAPARENLQLAHNALCAADVASKSAALVQINRTARAGPMEQAELDAFDLAAARDRIARIWQRASVPMPEVVTGDHCWRCECLPNCPAHLTMAIAFNEGIWPNVMPSDGLTVETVASAWERLLVAKKVLGLVEKTYRAFASQWPVPLANGKVLGEHEKETEEIDGAVARQALRDLHGQDVADAATEMSVTKASIERALAKIAPPRGKARMVREALGAIGAANGIRTNRKLCVEEFSPNKEK